MSGITNPVAFGYLRALFSSSAASKSQGEVLAALSFLEGLGGLGSPALSLIFQVTTGAGAFVVISAMGAVAMIALAGFIPSSTADESSAVHTTDQDECREIRDEAEALLVN